MWCARSAPLPDVYKRQVLPSVKFFFVGGRKIAFVGVTTPETFTKSTPCLLYTSAAMFGGVVYKDALPDLCNFPLSRSTNRVRFLLTMLHKHNPLRQCLRR